MDVLVATAEGVFDLSGEVRLDGSAVHHLARHHGEWWAVGEGGLFHNGESVAPPPAGSRLNCVAVAGDRTWVGADSARLFYLEDGRLVEDDSFAHAPGRQAWHTPWGGPPDVRSMSVDVAGTLWVNVHVGGILRHDGTSFRPTVDIDSDVHQVVAHPERAGTVAAASARGLALTSDSEFTFHTDGLDRPYCRAVALHGDTVLVSASRGPRGGDARLYRGSTEGGELRPCPGLPTLDGNIDTHCVLAAHDAYLVGHGSTVWQSGDGGDTWRVAAEGLPPIRALA